VSGAGVALRAGRRPRAGLRQTLRAEWLKLRTVRSTAWSLIALVTVSVLLSALAGWESETQGGSPGNPGDNDLVVDSLAGIWFGQIGVAVLGVLAITGEYASGTIRTTFAANPRRRTVLAAKTLVVGAVVLVVGLATSAACFLVGQSLLRSNGFTYENGYPALSLVDREPFRAVACTGLCLVLLGVFSLGVGAILRHTAGAITLVLALVLAPVIAISFLPERLADYVEKASLLAAGLATQQTVERPDSIPLSPWEGLAVVGAYAAIALLLALWLIGRRDA
jgi:ABC-2 type transport system permease protein